MVLSESRTVLYTRSNLESRIICVDVCQKILRSGRKVKQLTLLFPRNISPAGETIQSGVERGLYLGLATLIWGGYASRFIFRRRAL